MAETWQEQYREKLITGEEAANLIKGGDLVDIPMQPEPTTILYALAARMEDFRGNPITLVPGMQARDFPWYDPGWDDCVSIQALYVMPPLYTLFNERMADYIVPDSLIRPHFAVGKTPIDVILLTVSPPDRHGYCSLGGSVWYKHEEIAQAKLVIAEISPYQIRCYGNALVHASQIHHFVEHVSLGTTPQTRDMTGRVLAGPGPVEKAIAENVATMIKSGDTLMIGIGGATEYLEELGAFDHCEDLGIHSEIISRGMINGVRKGLVTGKRKTLHPGKAVGTGIGGAQKEYAYVDQNPGFELYSAAYVLDPRTVAQNDNQVTLASAFAIDLTGQAATDGLGFRMMAGTGGQATFAIGSMYSKDGRYILAMSSTTGAGISRIVSSFPPGTVVSTPRWLTEYVVTEYGVVNLRNKSQRQRALDMISIAHPDYRAELRKEAERVFWP